MAKKKRSSAPESGASWMDTYGDMVTLLLCFFVLLYSISSVDQAKWVMVVKSFNPDAKEVSQIALDADSEAKDDVPGNVDDKLDAFDDLYNKLAEAVEKAGLTSEVELFQGDGYTFVTFRDNIFFDGDSSAIKPEGEKILNIFGQIVSSASEDIKQIQVLGHTTQANATGITDPKKDRVLSSDRAAVVAANLDAGSELAPEKIVSIGYGQYRPIAPFDTEENRAKNRRVELLITKADSVERSLEEYYEDMNK